MLLMKPNVVKWPPEVQMQTTINVYFNDAKEAHLLTVRGQPHSDSPAILGDLYTSMYQECVLCP